MVFYVVNYCFYFLLETSNSELKAVFMSLTREAFLRRSFTKLMEGCLLKANSAFLRRLADGFRFTAIWSISSTLTLASLRQYLIASEGNPAQCFMRLKRSSSTATINCPSTIIHADESRDRRLFLK